MNRRSVSLSCLTKEEPPLVSKQHNELNSRKAELARWSEDLKRREKALQQKHEIRDQDLLYSGNQNLSPPSFHWLDRYPPNLSFAHPLLTGKALREPALIQAALLVARVHVC